MSLNLLCEVVCHVLRTAVELSASKRKKEEEYWAAGALKREEVVLQVVGLLGPWDGRELFQNYVKKDINCNLMMTLWEVLLNLLFALLICVVILFVSSTAISTRVFMSILCLCYGSPYPSCLYLFVSELFLCQFLEIRFSKVTWQQISPPL